MTRLLCVLLFATSAFAQYEDSITVARVMLEVRVTKSSGEPITDMKPGEFMVRVDGKPVRVISATWIDDAQFGGGDEVELDGAPNAAEEAAPELAEEPETELVGDLPPQPEGRTFVVLVLTDFGRAGPRVSGQVAFNSHAKKLIDAMGPNDRVAVLSFDSHLKFRHDFTLDKADALRAIRESILIDNPTAPPPANELALTPFLDREEMKRVTNAEGALLVLSKALKQIEGPKTLLLAGWGMGDRFAGRVYLDRDWDKARDMMLDARVTIVSLNTSDRPGELGKGLAVAAQSTGGFYATMGNPHQAINRITQTLRGRYDLELDASALTAGTHSITVHAKRRGAAVLAPMSVVVSGE